MQSKESGTGPSGGELAPEGIKIGELVRQTGVTRATVHHYVREGLLPKPLKTSRNMALYDLSCIERVLVIKRLQTQTRRPLSELKNLLSRAAGHEGIRHLKRQLDVDALREQVSPLHPNASRQDLDLSELSERTGFSRKELQGFCKIGLIAAHQVKGKKVFGAAEVAVADAMSGLRDAGFTEQVGFTPVTALMYVEAMRKLLHQEIATFLETAACLEQPGDLLGLAEIGIERVTPLILALRRKLMREMLKVYELPEEPNDE